MFVTIILSTIFVILIYYYIMILVKNTEVVIFIEVLILAFMSLSLSYTLGSTAGIKAADPSLTYPLVSVEVIHGTMIDQAWLYERTTTGWLPEAVQITSSLPQM